MTTTASAPRRPSLRPMAPSDLHTTLVSVEIGRQTPEGLIPEHRSKAYDMLSRSGEDVPCRCGRRAVLARAGRPSSQASRPPRATRSRRPAAVVRSDGRGTDRSDEGRAIRPDRDWRDARLPGRRRRRRAETIAPNPVATYAGATTTERHGSGASVARRFHIHDRSAVLRVADQAEISFIGARALDRSRDIAIRPLLTEPKPTVEVDGDR